MHRIGRVFLAASLLAASTPALATGSSTDSSARTGLCAKTTPATLLFGWLKVRPC